MNHVFFLGWESFWAEHCKQQASERVSLSGKLQALHMGTIQDDIWDDQLEKYSSEWNVIKHLRDSAFLNCALWKRSPKNLFSNRMVLFETER